MKPAPFELARPANLAEAAAALVRRPGAARLLAGGQSLGPMLNLRLAQPRLLIDITGIRELTRIEETRDAVTMGTCVTTANIEDGMLPSPGLDPLPAIASGIAYRGEAPRTYYFPRCNTATEYDQRGASIVNGISVGWADVYNWFLADQYIEISGVPDGDYVLETVANPARTVHETSFADNAARVTIRLRGDTVELVSGPTLPMRK